MAYLASFIFESGNPSMASSGGPLLAKVLNIGIIGACFGLFVSLVDFLLKPGQKKSIDDFIDSITLRLSYADTLNWLQRWLRTVRRAELVRRSISFLNVVGGIVFASILAYSARDEWGWAIFTFFIHLLMWFSLTRAVIKQVSENTAIEIVGWLASRGSFRELLIAYLKVLAYGSGVIAFLAAGIYDAKGHEGDLLSQYYGIGPRGYFIFLLFPFVAALLLCWLGVFFDGVILIVGATVVITVQKLVDAARWMMWRISSYPKGPFTATLTIVGAIFAIIKIFAS